MFVKLLNVRRDVIAQNYKTEVTAAAAASSSSRAELVYSSTAGKSSSSRTAAGAAAARSTASACSSNITCSIGRVEADHRRESLNEEDDDEDVFLY